MSRPSAWVWVGYGAGVLWVGSLLYHLDRNAGRAETSAFRREGERLAVLWAERLSDRPGSAEEVVRRLSGEPESRAVGRLDARGRELSRVGEALPSAPSSGRDEVQSRPLAPRPAWAHWAPLFFEGRPAGSLVWVRDAESLARSRRRRRLGLGGALAWWAAAGALGAAWLERRLRSSPRPTAPPASQP